MSTYCKIIALVIIFSALFIGCVQNQNPTEQIQPTDSLIPFPASPTGISLTNTPISTPQENLIPDRPAEPGVSAISPINEIVPSLQGLPLDDFFEESYRHLLFRDPEKLTALGLAGYFDLRNDTLNDLSDTFIRDTQKLESAILELLRTYNPDELTSQQQVSYEVYEWYLEDLVRGHEFMYYDYPVHHFYSGYHDKLIRLFTEIHPLDSKQDVEDYISRLSQVDDQIGQLLEGLKIRKEIGVIPPRFSILLSINGVHTLTDESQSNLLYDRFRREVMALDGFSEDEKQMFLDAAKLEIKESVSTAFKALETYLYDLSANATDEAGVWKFPNGDAYYAYILRNACSVDITPEEAHELGLTEVARIQGELRQAFDELGYPEDENFVDLLNRVIEDSGYYDTSTQSGKDEVVAAYEEILEEIDQRLDNVFDIRPQVALVVFGDMGSSGGGYYMEAAKDGSRPGTFHAGVGGSRVPKLNMSTIAYHEAIPGHHFQISIAQEADLPTFRSNLYFNGFGEGWGLYAEFLAWELGLYENDPYGNIGRLHLELIRSTRVVADTGIHALGWTREESYAYLREIVGEWGASETDRYIAWPAQSVGYKIGMLKILELRQRAMDQLADRFDIKEFHTTVLSNGSMPLEILERVVEDYIRTALDP